MADGCGVGGVGTKPKPLLSILEVLLSRLILSLILNLFAQFSIRVILFSIIFFSLCLSLSERLEASALLNILFLVDSILASIVS